MEKENQPPSKKRRLSLALKDRRFHSAEKNYLEKIVKPIVPKNTSVSTRWAMKNLSDWYADYNTLNPEHPCPSEILSPLCKAEILNDWLCVFVTETRTKNGEMYPPGSIHSLLTGILRNMRENNPDYPNFLNKDNPVFRKFMVSLDNVFKSLRSSGIGAESKHTEGISNEEEDSLWTSDVLNDTSPDGLLRALFFNNRKNFCLRGGQEHRDLGLSQIHRMKLPDKYVYNENSSKNRQGGLAQLKLEHKNVSIIANKDVGCRCHVHLLDRYISKLPLDAVEKDIFYCRPLPSIPSDPTKPWYSATPVGKNQLNKMVFKMCEMAGIEGVKTNHSLRVSGASYLFDAGVPERIIQARTGHRCLESLRL